MPRSPQAIMIFSAPYCGFTSLMNGYSLSAAIPAQEEHNHFKALTKRIASTYQSRPRQQL
jgi:hypothetical protein